jgi:peptide/nickel transport system permease protein
MLRYVVRRLLLLVPILIGVSILIFFWVHALPGNPASALLGERATPELVAQYKERYGLDRPLPVQYLDYVKVTIQGDLGTSITTRRSVTSEIRLRFPATIELAIAAMLFAIGIGLPLGFFAAKHYGGFFDNLSLVGSLIGISIPIFFLAIILKYFFAVKWQLLPSVGRQDVLLNPEHPTGFYVLDGLITRDWVAFWDAIKHLMLPAIALGSIPLAIVMRITRAAVLDVQNEDYVRTARAKGLTPQTVDRGHVFRNAMLPVVTVIGLQAGLLLSGAILTETVFAFPGMGTWVQEAIKHRDYPVLQGGILFIAVVVVLINLAVDIAYGFLDPRIRLSGR